MENSQKFGMLMVSFLWFWELFVVGVCGGEMKSDYQALMAFKSSSDKSNMLLSWTRKNPCRRRWYGVDCENGRVVRIVLENLDLVGSIDALTALDELRILSLKKNSFSGPLPDLSNWRSLKLLFLSNNYFTGPLPPSIGSLDRLLRLDVSGNELSGQIPATLASLAHLLTLTLDDNEFSGDISQLMIPTTLEVFNVSGNGLSGLIPGSLAKFPSSSFEGNDGLCGFPLKSCRSSSASNSEVSQHGGNGSMGSKPAMISAPLPSQGHNGHYAKLSKGDIVAIVVGDIAVLMLIACLVFCYYWKKQGDKKAASKPNKSSTKAASYLILPSLYAQANFSSLQVRRVYRKSSFPSQAVSALVDRTIKNTAVDVADKTQLFTNTDILYNYCSRGGHSKGIVKMVTLVVATTTDPASIGPASALLNMSSHWRPGPLLQDIPSFVNGRIRLLKHNQSIVKEDNLDNRWEELTGETVDEIIFLSKHTAVSNRPALTVHPIGVPHLQSYEECIAGGKPGWAGLPSPRIGPWYRFLKTVAEKQSLTPEFEVTLEATHHGPVVNKPTMFVEIGSTEEYWKRQDAAQAIALLVWQGLGLDGGSGVGNWTESEKGKKVLVGIGGGHYVPRHMDIVQKEDVWVGHLLSGYSLPMEEPSTKKKEYDVKEIGGAWKEAIKVAVVTTQAAFPGGEVLVHIDNKSFKGWQRNLLTQFLSQEGIAIGKPDDFV